MPSNEELLAAAEYVATHDLFELPEGDSDGGQVRYGENAEFLARHVRESLAGEWEGPVDDAWLESIGRGEFIHDGFYFCVAFNYRDRGVPYLIWRPEHANGDHWDAWPFPLTSRAKYLSLLSALGIEVKS